MAELKIPPSIPARTACPVTSSMERRLPPTCAGCGKSFTSSGLTNHLKQTHNPRCRAISNRLRAYIPDDRPSESDQDVFPDSPRFSGDFFADEYHPDDFPWDADQDPEPDAEFLPPDEDIDEFDADSESDSDCYQDLDIGWEPPVSDAGVGRTDLDDEDDDPDDPPPLPERSTAHDALQNPYYTEKFNNKYPDARAGMRFGTELDLNSQYQAGMPDNLNIWFPFSSKLDWEIARWAKLRGPSSTAFSELLAIDGVGGT